MKRRSCILTSVIFAISLFVISACDITYDSMLRDFNKEYFAPEHKKEKSVNDADFKAETMLEPSYDFYEGYVSSLTAPADAASYSWKTPKANVETPEYKELGKDRVFSFMPGKDFEAGSEIKVILTVTSKTGAEYIDTTIVRINRNLPI